MKTYGIGEVTFIGETSLKRLIKETASKLKKSTRGSWLDLEQVIFVRKTEFYLATQSL
jgi:hypothetical protein